MVFHIQQRVIIINNGYHHHQKQQPSWISIDHLLGIESLFQFHNLPNMFTDETLLGFTVTAFVSGLSVLANGCLLLHILRNKATRTSKNTCFGYYLIHCNVLAMLMSACALPYFIATNHVSSSPSTHFDWFRLNGRFLKHATCTCIHSTLAAMLYQRLLCLLHSSHKRKSLMNLKLNIILVWIWAIASVLPEVVTQSKADIVATKEVTGSIKMEIRENSSCTIAFIVLSFLVPLSIIVYSRFSVLRLRSTDSVLLVKRCREYRKFGTVCLSLSLVVVLCNLPEAVFDLLRLYDIERKEDMHERGSSANSSIVLATTEAGTGVKKIFATGSNLRIILSAMSWLYLLAFPIIYCVIYRVKMIDAARRGPTAVTSLFRMRRHRENRNSATIIALPAIGSNVNQNYQTQNHVGVNLSGNSRSSSIINNNRKNDIRTVGNSSQISNPSASSSFQQKLHQQYHAIIDAVSEAVTGTTNSNDSTKRTSVDGAVESHVERPLNVQQQRRMSASVMATTITTTKELCTNPTLTNKSATMRKSIPLSASSSTSSTMSKTNNNVGRRGSRRRSLFDRRKSTSSLDDVLDDCSRRFSEPNTDLNPELIASCLDTLESLYHSHIVVTNSNKKTSLLRLALRRFSTLAHSQQSQSPLTYQQETGSVEDNTVVVKSSNAQDIVTPFTHVIHKLNQKQNNE